MRRPSKGQASCAARELHVASYIPGPRSGTLRRNRAGSQHRLWEGGVCTCEKVWWNEQKVPWRVAQELLQVGILPAREHHPAAERLRRTLRQGLLQGSRGRCGHASCFPGRSGCLEGTSRSGLLGECSGEPEGFCPDWLGRIDAVTLVRCSGECPREARPLACRLFPPRQGSHPRSAANTESASCSTPMPRSYAR